VPFVPALSSSGGREGCAATAVLLAAGAVFLRVLPLACLPLPVAFLPGFLALLSPAGLFREPALLRVGFFPAGDFRETACLAVAALPLLLLPLPAAASDASSVPVLTITASETDPYPQIHAIIHKIHGCFNRRNARAVAASHQRQRDIVPGVGPFLLKSIGKYACAGRHPQ
jgi:hypothetical protein